MSMELILRNYLNQPKIELGNRTEYEGASEIRFERGNLG
jgi:hypothetical protein